MHEKRQPQQSTKQATSDALALNYTSPGVPTQLLEVLEKRLAPECNRFDTEIALKGGLAVAVYLGQADVPYIPAEKSVSILEDRVKPAQDPIRPVSPDIDWAMANTDHDTNASKSVVEALCGMNCEYKDALSKPVFHSRKISAETRAENGSTVELDAIAISRVQPGNAGFCFEFALDEAAMESAKTVTTPAGQSVKVVSPEFLIAEKLLAGRGPELNKLDYFDAAGLLVTQSVNAAKILELVAQQSYNSELDAVDEAERDSATKQQAFVAQLFGALHQLDESLEMKLPLIPGEPSISEVFGKKAVLAATAELRRQLREAPNS